MSEWKSIDTVPKDGAVVMIWRYYPCAARWTGDKQWPWEAMPVGATYGPFNENGFEADDPAITHWMPLPSAP